MIYMFENWATIFPSITLVACVRTYSWNYYDNQYRQKIYFYMASMMDMRKKYDVFNTSNFTYALDLETHQPNGSAMNATWWGTSQSRRTMYPNFQHTGTGMIIYWRQHHRYERHGNYFFAGRMAHLHGCEVG